MKLHAIAAACACALALGAQAATSNPAHKGLTNETPKAQCLQCHGSYSVLAERTAKLNPAFNPHYSHKGQENCTSCHRMQGKSQFICNDCHGFTGRGTDMK